MGSGATFAYIISHHLFVANKFYFVHTKTPLAIRAGSVLIRYLSGFFYKKIPYITRSAPTVTAGAIIMKKFYV